MIQNEQHLKFMETAVIEKFRRDLKTKLMQNAEAIVEEVVESLSEEINIKANANIDMAEYLTRIKVEVTNKTK